MSLAAVLPVSQEEARPPRPGLSARVRQAVWRVRGWLTRPHEFPLEIPDLVSPGLGRGGQTPRPGPPPNRSLPPAPPVSPSSAGWPTPPMNHVHGHVGVAVGLVSHSPAQGVTLRPESRELCELTESLHCNRPATRREVASVPAAFEMQLKAAVVTRSFGWDVSFGVPNFGEPGIRAPPRRSPPSHSIKVSLPALVGAAHRNTVVLHFATADAFRRHTRDAPSLARWICRSIPRDLAGLYPMRSPVDLPCGWRVHVLWLDRRAPRDTVARARELALYGAAQFEADMAALEGRAFRDAIWVGEEGEAAPERGGAVDFRYWGLRKADEWLWV
ncbi:hypothetical protein EV126DRAFT_398943 [Verticillium dahliae]|nr:hypothetical protein EV126DRAFT_398943 [Verticillium dahliae]